MSAGGLFGSLYGTRLYAGGSTTGRMFNDVGLVMTQVVAALRASALTTSQQVQFSLLEEPFADAGFPQLVVTPGAFRAIGRQLNGGGRYTTGLSGSFSVTAWVRNATDKAYLDINRLTDSQRGAYKLCNGVVSVLEEYFPLDPGTSSMLTEEGLKMLSVARPARGTKPNAAEGKSPEIAGIKITFETRIAMSLSETF